MDVNRDSEELRIDAKLELFQLLETVMVLVELLYLDEDIWYFLDR